MFMNIKLQTNCGNQVLEFVNAERYDDGSGFSAFIKVVSKGFAANVFVTFGEWPMEQFVENLQKCNIELSGEATLKPEWDNWYLKVSITHIGAVVIRGYLYEPGHELSFVLETDQTCLEPLIRDLKRWQNQGNT